MVKRTASKPIKSLLDLEVFVAIDKPSRFFFVLF